MILPNHRPFNEARLSASTASIGASPVSAYAVASASGMLGRINAAACGTTTGTIAVAVSVNGGADVTGGALTIAAGSGARNNPPLELPLVGVAATFVQEGDVITFTPSGGGGASIPGVFSADIRAQ